MCLCIRHFVSFHVMHCVCVCVSWTSQRKWYRNITMWGFHFWVSFWCVKNIRDTQCGFKLFTRSTAALLFASQHLRRWAFDAELLHIAQREGFPIAEVEVNWTEIAGSKLNLVDASAQMARDLVVIRLCYTFGLWKYTRLTPQYSPLQPFAALK